MSRLLPLLALPFVIGISGCVITGDPVTSPQGPPAREGRGLLPPPQAQSGPIAGTPPKHVFERDTTGAFSRTVFSATSAHWHVTARDITVPPHQQTLERQLSGAALIEVNAGVGTATVGGVPTTLVSARRFTVAAGAPFSIANSGDQELAIRLYVIGAQP